ncbi:MAG TPA: NAD(P)/FAD-dependent oxidoreductase [Streptomyces sp.]|uniref:FAD-dependent oxidoreductase n=1 Tax=Streptomyces sp. TaxID=1931 RepID=UPI002C56A5DF|nr:NAD(P)/FAD-dependent oxidoreductase [Streptomyces sp.]HWU11962.1 NAD(P)/FAD-dependent oxidoreductase [Streptomyces sp.]
MLTPVALEEQLAAVRRNRLRVLVVGAGVAGVTLAQFLRAAGLDPVLVDRRGADADPGYMLGLMPLVDPPLAHLKVQDAYRERSVPVRRYAMRGRSGRPLRQYSLGSLLEFGDYRGISRGELLAALADTGGAVAYGATVTRLAQQADVVRAVLSDGASERTAEFDAVIAADGLHSSTRKLVLSTDQVTGYDTGWTGWVGWAEPDDAADLYEECWGAGFFVGLYPVKGRTGVFVGGPRSATAAGAPAFVVRVRGQLRGRDPRVDRALTAIAAGRDVHSWSLTDVRAATWSVGRVGLVGDAAAGFLPTAGVGAAMAMESAAVLGRSLAEAAPGAVTDTLRRYEARQRPRVQAAQQNSRVLARLMFRRSLPVAVVRDAAARFVTLDRALAPIRRLLSDRTDL